MTVEQLPVHVRTGDDLAAAIAELFERMTADTSLPADRTQLGELLGLDARVLVSRLALGDAGSATEQLIDPTTLERFRKYRSMVDQQFRRWHLVAPYARHLGCSVTALVPTAAIISCHNWAGMRRCPSGCDRDCGRRSVWRCSTSPPRPR